MMKKIDEIKSDVLYKIERDVRINISSAIEKAVKNEQDYVSIDLYETFLDSKAKLEYAINYLDNAGIKYKITSEELEIVLPIDEYDRRERTEKYLNRLIARGIEEGETVLILKKSKKNEKEVLFLLDSNNLDTTLKCLELKNVEYISKDSRLIINLTNNNIEEEYWKNELDYNKKSISNAKDDIFVVILLIFICVASYIMSECADDSTIRMIWRVTFYIACLPAAGSIIRAIFIVISYVKYFKFSKEYKRYSKEEK